jgi:hypothetical protein
MPVTADKPAPYTAASPVLDLINRHRSKGLPEPVNAEVLGRAGIPESLVARTLQSLQTLDLIDESGKITEVFEGLRLAPESEFKKRLEEWLNAAYADVIKFVDPATATESQIRDAFRTYKPIGQQSRMVILFTMLYAAAGIGTAKPAAPKATTVNRSSVARKPVAKTETKKTSNATEFFTGMPPALDGLLKSLPLDGKGWTQEQRDKFVATFPVIVDFCFPVVSASAPVENQEEEDQE